jgi:NAD(P)-dependent dehydrogenase (short-subunit alcohol dehydrogenase family)
MLRHACGYKLANDGIDTRSLQAHLGRRPNRLDRAGQGSLGRDPRAASRQRAGIAHSVYLADLLHLAEMKRVAARIADHEPRIDVMINNAGALFATRRFTEDGLECTFALNHMAYFVATEGLRERPSPRAISSVTACSIVPAGARSRART